VTRGKLQWISRRKYSERIHPMKSFVVFANSKVFSKLKVWDIKDIKSKYPQSQVSGMIFLIDVKSSGRVIQQGIVINAEDELEALDKYDRLKNG